MIVRAARAMHLLHELVVQLNPLASRKRRGPATEACGSAHCTVSCDSSQDYVLGGQVHRSLQAVLLVVVVSLLAATGAGAEGWHYDSDYPSPLAGIDSLAFSYVESPGWSEFPGNSSERGARVFAMFREALAAEGIRLGNAPSPEYRVPVLVVMSIVRHWSGESFFTFTPRVQVVRMAKVGGADIPVSVWNDFKEGYCGIPTPRECTDTFDYALSGFVKDLVHDFRLARATRR